MLDLNAVVNRKGTHCFKWDDPMFDGRDDITSMTIADMDWQSPQAVIDAVVKQAETGIYGYPLWAPDEKELLSSITDWLESRCNWSVTPDRLGFAVRVVDLLAIAVCSMTNEGDSVITQAPLYGHFESVIVNAKRKIVRNMLVRTNGVYEIDFKSFEQQIIENDVKMFILCNPHNPSGRVWTKEELKRLLDICIKHNVIIVSDEIHSDLTLPGYEYTPMGKLAEECGYDRFMVTKSPSKTFNLAGLQFGYYISGSKEIMTAIEGEKEYRSYPDLPNNFSTVATIAAYTEGAEWLDAVREYIQQNFFVLRNHLANEHPKVWISELQGTYLAWVDVSYLGISEKELQERLLKAGLGADTTSEFGMDEGLYVRMNIACPRKTLEAGIAALDRALEI